MSLSGFHKPRWTEGTIERTNIHGLVLGNLGYNTAMSPTPNRFLVVRFISKSLLVLALIVGTGVGGYHMGYSRGAGEVVTPRASLRLLNTTSTGEFSILPQATTTTNFGVFWKTWNILDKNFVPSSTSSIANSSEARVLGAIEGLVASYDDPYTVFIPKEKTAAFNEQVNAEFEGIGAVLSEANGEIVVTGLLPDSPALKAGLKPGDRILAVDDQPTQGQTLITIIPRIRGPKGTVVSLTINSVTTKQIAEVPITRGMVVIPTTATRVVTAAKNILASVVEKAITAAASVPGLKREAALAEANEKAAKIAEQKFFVLQLATFARSSVDAFIVDLQKFAKSGGTNLIIDLRNNPGGYLDVAVDLASYFLPNGQVVVTEKSGAAGVVTEHRSTGHPLLDSATSTRRVVVLLNRNSASASEILAGALQDYGVARVVGEKSFGKGSVQTVVDIGEIGSLKITIARWFTPKGRNISFEGITPDIVVDTSDEKYASSTDPFMDAAVEALLEDALWLPAAVAN